MWCWRWMEKTIWIERVKKERNILHTIKRSKEKLIGLSLRRNNFLNIFWKE